MIPKDLAARAEAYKQACLALDRTAAAMGARAIIVTYRIDEDDHPAELAVIGGCCMEHVVKALSCGINYVVDHSLHEDDDEEERITVN